MIIAIDGPAGSGKSTVAKCAAGQLNFHYLDTGAMYRALAVCAVRNGIDFGDETALVDVCGKYPITFGYEEGEVLPSKVFLDKDDVSDSIRTPEIDKAVSPVSAHQRVRDALVEQQRRIAQGEDYVVEGRDIGTAVFPSAEVKIFITASPEERAQRRALQNHERGMEDNFDKIYQAILVRDKADTERTVSPLRPADDATIIDTTNMTLEKVIEAVVTLARRSWKDER